LSIELKNFSKIQFSELSGINWLILHEE